MLLMKFTLNTVILSRKFKSVALKKSNNIGSVHSKQGCQKCQYTPAVPTIGQGLQVHTCSFKKVQQKCYTLTYDFCRQ